MFVQQILLFMGAPLIILFPFVSHPLLMGLMILSLTMLISISIGLLASNLWVSYILVLVLLGGLLVIFIYVSLLAANELFLKKSYIPQLFLVGYLGSMVFMTFNSFEEEAISSNFLMMTMSDLTGTEWLMNFYSSYSSYFTMFLVMYLLLTLIVVMSVTKNDSSSLRSMK